MQDPYHDKYMKYKKMYINEKQRLLKGGGKKKKEDDTEMSNEPSDAPKFERKPFDKDDYKYTVYISKIVLEKKGDHGNMTANIERDPAIRFKHKFEQPKWSTIVDGVLRKLPGGMRMKFVKEVHATIDGKTVKMTDLKDQLDLSKTSQIDKIKIIAI
jgi:hypothetical protein